MFITFFNTYKDNVSICQKSQDILEPRKKKTTMIFLPDGSSLPIVIHSQHPYFPID